MVPSDFVNICVTGMEEDMGKLVNGTDDWASFNENVRAIPWHDRSVLSDRQVALETWRGRYQPILQVDIEPWAVFYMAQPRKGFSMELLKGGGGLGELSKNGTSKQRILPDDALISLTRTKDGEPRVAHSYWGLARRRGDFTAQALTIACLQSQVIDFGDSTPISAYLMRRTGNTENIERNQCVLLHLAAGMMRGETGREKRVPDRGRLFSLTQELRRVEIKTALLAGDSANGGFPMEATIVTSNARDFPRPSRDQDFRSIGFLALFLPNYQQDSWKYLMWEEGPTDMMFQSTCSLIQGQTMGTTILT